jgi:hypothetical protein
MKRGKVFFHPIDGTAALTISWSSRPKGDAIEAKRGDGVGFFSDKGDLLCVIFDEVSSKEDQQILEFSHWKVEVRVKGSKVAYHVTEKQLQKKVNKSKVSRKSNKRKSSSSKNMTITS